MTTLPTKIMIFGRPGGGKSTFALKLHKATGIPLHHLDKYFYVSNWIERDYQEFLSLQQAIVDKSSWIIDGNCTRSLKMRYHRANLVVYFNYPRWLCYWRIFKRLFNKNTEINDRADGCEETINLKLLSYMWSFENRVAEQIKNLKKQCPHTRFIEIKSDKDLQQLEHELTSKYF